MPRKALIAANWKMYKTPAEAKAFVDAFLPLVAWHTRDEIALFPSPVLLPTVVEGCKRSNVAVGAQNIHFAEEGAYTGETSCWTTEGGWWHAHAHRPLRAAAIFC